MAHGQRAMKFNQITQRLEPVSTKRSLRRQARFAKRAERDAKRQQNKG
jgi:hypothetical protein